MNTATLVCTFRCSDSQKPLPRLSVSLPHSGDYAGHVLIAVRAGWVTIDGTCYHVPSTAYVDTKKFLAMHPTPNTTEYAEVWPIFGVVDPQQSTMPNGDLWVAVGTHYTLHGEKLEACSPDQNLPSQYVSSNLVRYEVRSEPACATGYGVYAIYRVRLLFAYYQNDVLYSALPVDIVEEETT